MEFNKLFSFLILGIFLFSFASAQQVYQVDVENDITVTCLNVNYCSASAYCNINVEDPNEDLIITNNNMTNQISYHNYTFTPTELGKYKVSGFCVDGTYWEEIDFDFLVTYSGKEIEQDGVLIYMMSIVVLVLFLLFIFYAIQMLPSSDSVDEDGTILHISMLKHLRPVLWTFCWGIVMSIVFISGNLSLAYLETSMVGDLFMSLFIIMFGITLVGLPLWFIKIFTGIFRDKEVKQMIERGVDVKTP